MAWDLRGNMDDEIDRVLALADHTADRVAQLYPPYAYRAHDPIVARGAVVDGVFEQDATAPGTRNPTRPAYTADMRDALGRLRASVEAMPALLGRGDGLGSNALGGRRRALRHRKAAARQRPAPRRRHAGHLDADGPALPHGHRRLPPRRLRLHASPACPGVVIGHNADIAWGFTNLGPDVTDLYLEKVDGDRWRYDGRWRPLRTRTETIEVHGGDDVELTVRETPHGPLLSDVDDDVRRGRVQARAPAGTPSPCAWTALEPTRTADASWR